MRGRRWFGYVGAACLAGSLLAGATPAAAAAPPNLDIDTIAGQPTAGDPTQIAQQPFGLAVDQGRILVADPANHVVRALVPCSLIATAAAVCQPSEFTVVGNGGMSSEGDGGDPAAAQLAGPYAVAVATSPNASVVYIADTFAHRIRSYVESSLDGGPAPILSTVSGTGSFGFSGDGGPASDAQLNSPYGLAVSSDPQNGPTLYIADTLNNRIRAVRPDGTIVTVAGTGVAGFAGDGGPATSAELNRPRGLALDCLGRLYIADTANNVVRRYDPTTQIISTVAGTGAVGYGGDGGPAAQARLRQPAAVAVDPSSCDLYVADTGNNAVRKVSAGAITTIAGPATGAGLNSPFALAVQPGGALLIGDTGNNVIRMVSKGVISTIAGNGTASLSVDGEGQPQLAGLTSVDQIGGRTQPLCGQTSSPTQTLVLDTFNHALRAICGSQTFDRIGNGRPGQLAYPMGMAIDGPDVYIADTFNNVVRMLDTTTMTPSVVAGTGSAGFSGDGGPATSAQLDYPTALAVDHEHNLYIADTYNDRIRKVDLRNADPATHTISTIAGTGILGSGGDGGPGTQAQLFFPFGLAVDGSSPTNVYIADSFNNRIRHLDPSGVISTLAGTGVAGFKDGPRATAQFDRPWGIAVDTASPQPNVYVADYLNHRVRVVSGSTVSTLTGTGKRGLLGDPGPAAAAEVNAPRGIGVTDDPRGPVLGPFLVADTFNNLVRRIGAGQISAAASLSFPDTRTGTTSAAQTITVTNTGTGYTNLTGVAVDNPAFKATSCPAPGLHPGQSCSILVTFNPMVRSTISGTLTVKDDAGQAFPVALQGKGIEPAVTLLDSQGKDVTFKDIYWNEGDANPTVTVRNSGDAPLHISSWRFDPVPPETASGFASPSDCVGTLSPGATCQFTITLYGGAPPADPTKPHNATLSFTDDAAPSGQTATHTVGVHYIPQRIG